MLIQWGNLEIYIHNEFGIGFELSTWGGFELSIKILWLQIDYIK